MRVSAARVRAVIESMNGARFVHDTLEELGWEVLVADAQKVKGLAPLACKTDEDRRACWRCSRTVFLARVSRRGIRLQYRFEELDEPAR